MTIDKAVEFLEELLGHYSPSDEGDILDALHLAIEALKRVEAEREKYSGWSVRSLTGETK